MKKKYKSAGYTAARYNLKETVWTKVKTMLQLFLETYGEGAQTEIANAVGVHSSQIHRFSCPRCEHNQEPSFSVGMAILYFLAERMTSPVLDGLATLQTEEKEDSWTTMFNEPPAYGKRPKKVAVIREGNDWQTIQLN